MSLKWQNAVRPSPRLHGEVPRRLRGRRGGAVADLRLLGGRRLDEEAVVPLVDVLALLDDAEHGLVHLVALRARIFVGGGGTGRPVPQFLLKWNKVWSDSLSNHIRGG